MLLLVATSSTTITWKIEEREREYEMTKLLWMTNKTDSISSNKSILVSVFFSFWRNYVALYAFVAGHISRFGLKTN